MPSTRTARLRVVSCDHCGVAVDLTGRIGRPPRFCSAECRRVGRRADDRARHAAHRAEIKSLRALVAAYEASAPAA